MSKQADQVEAALAVVAAIFVIFTAMMDARVSALAAFVLLLALAGFRIIHSRHT